MTIPHPKLFQLLPICSAIYLMVWGMLSCDRSTSSRTEEIPQVISYNFHIRPILSDNCFACHGPDANKREAGLRLDLADAAYSTLAENPGKYGIVPGKPRESEVWNRIFSSDEMEVMPPPSSHLTLTSHQKKLIETWIKQGATYEKHWAFVPPQKPEIPTVKNKAWPQNAIDFFVLHKQESLGLTPNPVADRERLLRRVNFELTGLPPDLARMETFLSDKREDAYERLVDELLDSPAYGERMALLWMDVARYADSYGYQLDNLRTQWPWRDWVIHAFNQNLPYDTFIRWQLAGDLLPDPTKEQLLATGFNRNHKITEEGAIDEEEYRVTYVADRTNTLGKALLGITLECAACHDHKYDPISQKEYYELFSFFNNIDERRTTTTPIDPLVGTSASYAKKPLMEITDEDVHSVLSFVNKQDTARLIVSVMGELDTLRKNHVRERGIFDAYGEEVFPATPEAILSFPSSTPPNRLGLVDWLFDPQNPLTARVFVNLIWKDVFGRGIVNTPGDFGMQGELPSHPELLDWLARDFMENGWNIKRLMRQLVTSATFRQSVVADRQRMESDPENTYLTRFSRQHLKAEFIRDMVLASSGLLVQQLGGPSVKPYQPPGLWEGATAGGSTLSEYKQDTGAALYRRGLYNFVKRTVPPPFMLIFDASNRDQCEVERGNTNTPLQALVMMNDPTVLEASRVFASRLELEPSSVEDKISRAFRVIVCRHPKEKEKALLLDYYHSRLAATSLDQANELLDVGEYPIEEEIDPITTAALMQVITALYNLEETINRS
ncbi:MAG: PSD1 domain-containing protein [Lunatimonas sp.]|uniref:PSD1 and planctomycete cytochrome C domain-containing protein n=1 Tax=Lunatimonas sp. TaxID=2060141 RepID=UPI00263A7632|nr:PSD1 and planctomycete cytochrome C domain-containing protein [Lunatimonas sp.]MCC5936052.1 PSD1 domain-containing protein [Lunatimonas sp.]